MYAISANNYLLINYFLVGWLVRFWILFVIWGQILYQRRRRSDLRKVNTLYVLSVAWYSFDSYSQSSWLLIWWDRVFLLKKIDVFFFFLEENVLVVQSARSSIRIWCVDGEHQLLFFLCVWSLKDFFVRSFDRSSSSYRSEQMMWTEFVFYATLARAR